MTDFYHSHSFRLYLDDDEELVINEFLCGLNKSRKAECLRTIVKLGFSQLQKEKGETTSKKRTPKPKKIIEKKSSATPPEPMASSVEGEAGSPAPREPVARREAPEPIQTTAPAPAISTTDTRRDHTDVAREHSAPQPVDVQKAVELPIKQSPPTEDGDVRLLNNEADHSAAADLTDSISHETDNGHHGMTSPAIVNQADERSPHMGGSDGTGGGEVVRKERVDPLRKMQQLRGAVST